MKLYRYPLVLASQSPRRKQLLEKAGFRFQTAPVDTSEIPPENLSISEQIQAIAKEKRVQASHRWQLSQNATVIILAADTLVVLDEKLVSKPKDEQDAFQILRALSGREHQVMTAISLGLSDLTVSKEQVCISRVQFRDLSDQEIWEYIRTGEPMDKAGAYGMQGLGQKFVAQFHGTFENIVGLDTEVVTAMLADLQLTIPARTQVIAVSKTQPAERIRQAFMQGFQHFGENYLQEFLAKQPALAELPIEWHFIGRLQSNKIKKIVQHFRFIHSVGCEKHWNLVCEEAARLQAKRFVFFEVNIDQVANKDGWAPAALIDWLTHKKESPWVTPLGLMVMPEPKPLAPQQAFTMTQQLLNVVQKIDPRLQQLSMGTTQDYSSAIEVGTDWIRLGTLLFGPRQITQ